MSTAPSTIREQFGVKRRLGPALYGAVFLCHDLTQPDHALVAVKQVNLRDAKRRLDANPHLDNPWQERKISERLRLLGPHDHILTYRDNFMDNGAWYIVMDYCDGGDLLALLQSQRDGRLCEREALDLFRQVVRGVAHLHASGIAHRDLSLENVLLQDGVCKLSDFGLSTDAGRACTERVGKAYYMAPEVVSVSGCGYDPKAADMWSLGVMLFIMLTGSPLVQLATGRDRGFVALKRFGVEKILDVWGMSSSLSRETLDLVSTLLQVDPVERPRAQELLNHPALEWDLMF